MTPWRARFTVVMAGERLSRVEQGVEILDPVAGDPRFASVGEAPVAWADGDVLTIAVRRSGQAPYLMGTVDELMRPAGHGCWALRLRVCGLDRACIEYGVPGEASGSPEPPAVWQGPRARRPASLRWDWIEPLESHVVGRSKVAAVHPVRFWSPPDPEALLVCADGDGLEGWAGLVAASGEPVALVGIEDGGLVWEPGTDVAEYDAQRDPRARAYLPDVDPAYFSAHMKYVVEEVLPWADECLGRRLPRLVFGVSNGAAWAASLAAEHPDLVAGVLAFSLGVLPREAVPAGAPAHALVAGRLEPGFHRDTTTYARKLRRVGVPVRLRTPMRGHDYTMWRDEFVPALRWALHATA
jgi:enterochelin esterase-like enzyme